MKVGNIIILKNKFIGIILELDDADLKKEGYMWVKISWQDGKITWEDIKLNNDKLFRIEK